MKQRIFDELEKSVKRVTDVNGKKRIAELIRLLNKLNEIIDESSEKSIETGLELLGHKLSAVMNASAGCEKALSLDRREALQAVQSPQRNDSDRLYLGALLAHCGLAESAMQDKWEDSRDLVADVIDGCVWPDIFRRIEQRTNRPQITVDLVRLTSEEKSVVEDVASECVETFMEQSLIE